ncbi:MAG: DUF362 domain-containing protein [Spirochaetes bacterium]|nr:DUF362 domain-containing protein [Spirochaetota bacterium]
MLRRGLREYAGKRTAAEAVRSLFPSFRPDLRVAIKINTASSIMPSHRVVAETMASCLVEAGIAPGNIMIWERGEGTMRDAGYVISAGGQGVQVIATDTPGYGYDESRTERVGGVPVYLTRIITERCDALINIAALKHHYFAGITGTQKNLYGAIPLVDRPFMIGLYDLMRLHLNHSDPCISELNALVAEKVPTVLYICDALLGSYNNGPLGPPQWAQKELLLGDDPVAIDTLMLYRVELKRREAGHEPVLYKARHILTSANMGLGTNDPENMDIRAVTL